MAAREAILLASSVQSEAVNNEEVKKVTTVCMAHGTEPKDWSFHGNDYQITHMPGNSKENVFQSCLDLVNNIIKDENVHTPSGKSLEKYIELQCRRQITCIKAFDLTHHLYFKF